MRGADITQESLFTTATLAHFVPQNHPLREIRALVDEALGRMNSLFSTLYPETGRASIAPETTYSFPSGHAMGSMTLASVAVMLAWHTRWRVPVSLAGMAFVLLVGMSRVYLGVHYPSDILAGWCAAGAWSVACYLLVFRERGPWRDAPSVSR